MKKIVFGHQNPDTDTICSALVYALGQQQLGNEVTPYRLGDLNKETIYVLNYLKMPEPKLLTEVTNEEVVLVDHNEFSQSIKNIKEANIVAVYDHHRVANFETKNPIDITIKPVGCTTTVLYDEFKNEKVTITKEMAVLMVSAIISDTLLFKSPTCTAKDIKVGKDLAQIAELDLNTYGMEMLKAGTDLAEFTTNKLLDLDTKVFEIENNKYEIGQINTVDIKEVQAQRNEELIEKITKRVVDNKLGAFIFIITDIVNSDSIAYVIGELANEVAQKFDSQLEGNIIKLPGVVSRKKQVVPFL
ncbi:MAG: manganese-dependent inorganic pyrophosphatase [Mycoplasmatales bacterium]